jgi:hypothetical protein
LKKNVRIALSDLLVLCECVKQSDALWFPSESTSRSLNALVEFLL